MTTKTIPASFVLGLLILVSAQAANERVSATLPNGATVELVAVTYNDHDRDTENPGVWWQPDGKILKQGFYHYAGSGTSTNSARQFTMRVRADKDYSCMTVNTLGRTPVQPQIPFDPQNTPLPQIRAFIGLINESLSQDTVRVGVATGPWQMVEQWKDSRWEEPDPDNIMFPASKNSLVAFWPRKKRGAIIFEMVSSYTDQALRLKVTKQGGHSYYENPRTFGEGKGLVRHQYWLWDIKLEELESVALEKRAYQWVEFQNISLEPNTVTEVQAIVLPVVDDEARSVASDAGACLGTLLDELHKNVKLPWRGHAVYDVRVGSRLVSCDYLFDGSRYRFEVAEAGENTNVTLFDGFRSVLWVRGYDYASINRLERMDSIVYKLDQYCPKKEIDALHTHDVIPLPDEVVDGVSCKVLKNVISAKEQVKLWIATEPGVFPLRIERYEQEQLRDRYSAKDLCLWKGVVFPKTLSIARFRQSTGGKSSLFSQKDITLHSFVPGLEVTPKMLGQDLPVTVLARLPELKASVNSLIGKPLASLKISGLIECVEEGRPVLVCFVEVNQRPSRHCLKELQKYVAEFKEGNIQVVVVQTSQVEKEQLEPWKQVDDIPVAILSAGSEFEQKRSDWGIQSLPWAILTDADHLIDKNGIPRDVLNTLKAEE